MGRLTLAFAVQDKDKESPKNLDLESCWIDQYGCLMRLLRICDKALKSTEFYYFSPINGYTC